MTTTSLLVVAKAPVPGLVKTRLCPPATADEAAEIAAASLLDTLEAVRNTPEVRPVIALAGDLSRAVRSADLLDALRGWKVLSQRGSTFAQRLAAAHADTSAAHPGLPVLQIGMDTPQVTPELLSLSCETLRGPTVDAVFGPAEDGGWWAIGFRMSGYAALLGDIPTSCSDTGARTLAALCSVRLRIWPLPELSDVDTMWDAERVAALLPNSRFAASLPAGLRR